MKEIELIKALIKRECPDNVTDYAMELVEKEETVKLLEFMDYLKVCKDYSITPDSDVFEDMHIKEGDRVFISGFGSAIGEVTGIVIKDTGKKGEEKNISYLVAFQDNKDEEYVFSKENTLKISNIFLSIGFSEVAYYGFDTLVEVNTDLKLFYHETIRKKDYNPNAHWTENCPMLFEKASEHDIRLEINKDRNIVEVGFTSPAGMDYSAIIELGDSFEDFQTNVSDYAENFDVDYETYIWLGENGHGKYGAPYHLIDVYNDAVAIQNKLTDFAQFLNILPSFPHQSE